jgi:hypothetical protein
LSKTVGYNGVVGLVPFRSTAVKVEIKNGVGKIENKVNLEGLEVIFGDGKSIRPGDTVWVDQSGSAGWGKKVYEMDGKKFVVCRPEHVVLVTHQSDA